jgi:tetratricopeptide (TPR) repeat protein
MTDAFAMGAPRRPGPLPGGNTPGQSDPAPNSDAPAEDEARTSDEYEAAVDFIEENKYHAAIAELEKALVKYPKSADVLNYLAYCNRKLNETDKAMAYYRDALAINPKHRGVHAYLGELFLQMDNLKKAEKELTTLGLLCPEGCEEQLDLKEAIEAYKLKTASAAPSATSD